MNKSDNRQLRKDLEAEIYRLSQRMEDMWRFWETHSSLSSAIKDKRKKNYGSGFYYREAIAAAELVGENVKLLVELEEQDADNQPE